ncbi:uncharacterized protein [Misgurnus anguillicaudatus]|uniref:uncharacterized protein n=1 Tax=Misgurnus anguillicaudatus TaxID=75329 RepID=UPI003CCF5AA8
MTTAQTVCLLCFVLLLGSAHANEDRDETSGQKEYELPTTPSSSTDKKNETLQDTTDDTANITSKMESTASASKCVCTLTPNCTSSPNSPPTPKSTPNPPKTPTKDDLEHYTIALPKEKTLILVLVVLAVACITLLLITLLCTCHVCHLRAVISRLQPYHSVDLYSVKKRSESPCKDDGKEKDQPTETCLMLAEVTVQEEEKKEEKKEEKEEESVPIYTEPPAEKPNGDVTQEENAYDIVSDEPAVGTTEVSDTGV